MAYMPNVLDFACAHPGCGARRGWRCIYSGYRIGHPIRRARVVAVLDRKIRDCKSESRRAALIAYRTEFFAQGNRELVSA